MNEKETIVELFRNKVRGKRYEKIKDQHCGAEGHWLEKQFGISHNSSNAPDIMGYEMKKQSKKITFGDWSADEYIYNPKNMLLKLNENIPIIDRETFIKTFGTPNLKKKNRYSWSGKCSPKYNKYNDYGQILIVNDENIYAIYKHNQDKYIDIKPPWVKHHEILILAYWSKEKLNRLITNKFNQKGFFICKKNSNGIYNKICFGQKIDYQFWLECVKKNIIIFDSGMYQGNARNYSQWRASRKFWDSLIIEEFE